MLRSHLNGRCCSSFSTAWAGNMAGTRADADETAGRVHRRERSQSPRRHRDYPKFDAPIPEPLVGRAAAEDEKAGFPRRSLRLTRALPQADLVPRVDRRSPAVSGAISDPSRRVVGIVINEIDALSSGLSPIGGSGSADGTSINCLDAALNAGRLCVVTADHGRCRLRGATAAQGAERSGGD
jgi:hypothetical protein